MCKGLIFSMTHLTPLVIPFVCIFICRDLMNTRSLVPDWLLDLLMGYLDPAAAHYSRRPDFYEVKQNWFDTFLSPQHLSTAFPQYRLKFVDSRYQGQEMSPAADESCDDKAASIDSRKLP